MYKNRYPQHVGGQIFKTDGTPYTGTGTARLSLDGAPFAPGIGVITHLGTGYFDYLPGTAETNHDHIAVVLDQLGTAASVIPALVQTHPKLHSNSHRGGRTFYIAPSGGSDSNPGTYNAPLATFTRFAAICADYDTLIVMPGSHLQAAKADFSAFNGLSFIGGGKNNTAVLSNVAASYGFDFGPGTVLRGIKIQNIAADGTRGCTMGSDSLIEDSWIIGNTDAAYCGSSINMQFIRSRFESKWDVNVCGSDGLFVIGCEFYSDCSVANVSQPCGGLSLGGNGGPIVIRNTTIEMVRSTAASVQTTCLAVPGDTAGHLMTLELTNVTLRCASTNVSATGPIYCVDAGTSGAGIINATVSRWLSSMAGSGVENQIRFGDANGKINLLVCNIDTTKIIGSATVSNITADMLAALARLGSWTGTGVNTILGALRAIVAKGTAISVPSDLGTGFDNTTDSLQAVRDQGDVSWLTGTQNFTSSDRTQLFGIGTGTGFSDADRATLAALLSRAYFDSIMGSGQDVGTILSQVLADVGINLSRIQIIDEIQKLGDFSGTGVSSNTVKGFLQALARVDFTVPTDMAGSYNPATASLEALKDNAGTASVDAQTVRNAMALPYTGTAAVQSNSIDKQLQDIQSTVNSGDGQNIDPSYVGSENRFKFEAPDQLTASNVIRQAVGFNALTAMDVSQFVLPHGVSLSSAVLDSVYVQNPSTGDYELYSGSGTGLDITTPISLDPEKKEARMQTHATAAGTYRAILKFTTTDSQDFYRRGIYIIENKVGTA